MLATIKEQDVKYVDFRFTDPRGKWQHLAHTVATVDEELLTEGVMFDGSSIAGWKAINESDMTLMPDCKTAVLDPFAAQTSLVVFCDVLRAAHRAALCARPALDRQACRGLSEDHRASATPRSSGPEAEFFVFDDVRYEVSMNGAASTSSTPTRVRMAPARSSGAGQPRPPSADQGRLLPGAAGRRSLATCARR